MDLLHKKVSNKILIIGMVAMVATGWVAAYAAGVKEVASLGGFIVGSLVVVVLVMYLYHHQLRMRKADSLLGELKKRRKQGDK